jgi:hypothetical protein
MPTSLARVRVLLKKLLKTKNTKVRQCLSPKRYSPISLAA